MGKNFGSEGVFERIEKKYLLTEEQYEQFYLAVSPYITQDMYGKHTICNIYYDTVNYELIRQSIEKPKYKEKLRMRSYGVPALNDQVYLELKKKVNQIVYKRRAALTLKEALAYLNDGVKPREDNQIIREIQYFKDFYKPVPKLYLAYDRSAYFGNEDSDFRLTIDENIRSRKTDLRLDAGDYGELLYGGGYYLMEIKVPMAYPIWLVNALSRLEIYPVSFSKYGNIYKENIYTVTGQQLAVDKKEIKQKMEDRVCLQAY